jgi:hypothetical protein
MFTEPVPPEKVAAFAEFLGAEVVSTEVLTAVTDRSSYFSCPECRGNFFSTPTPGFGCKAYVHGRPRHTFSLPS